MKREPIKHFHPPAAADLADRPVALALSGEKTHGRLLAGLLPWLAEGRAVYCVDGGNVFDPLLLARLARQAGFDSTDILERLFVSRAYTCHQLLAAVRAMLEPLLARDPRPVVIILQVDRLFHDEDIPLTERGYLFDRIAEASSGVHRRGLPILITLCPGRPNPWAERLARVMAVGRDLSAALDAVTGATHGPHAADLQHVSGSGDFRVERLSPGAPPRGSGRL